MTYSIRSTNDKEFDISFKFERQSAEVNIEVMEPRELRMSSMTDGYHWLQLWMAQDPHATELLALPWEQERDKVAKSLDSIGFRYEPEDKESCYLHTREDVNPTTVDRFAQYLNPRFALREKLFPTD